MDNPYTHWKILSLSGNKHHRARVNNDLDNSQHTVSMTSAVFVLLPLNHQSSQKWFDLEKVWVGDHPSSLPRLNLPPKQYSWVDLAVRHQNNSATTFQSWSMP